MPAPVTADSSKNGGLRISVVIPTYRRPQLLERCLAALVRQRLDGAAFEIIVVDDGPNADTQAVTLQWATGNGPDGPRVRYLASPGPHGPAAARNFGWRAAQGEIVAFTDDDTLPEPDWLTRGLSAFADATLQAAWGRIVMPLSDVPTDYERDAQGLMSAEFATANCFCRKRSLRTVNGFDERFRLAWREDADLYFRLLRCHAKVMRIADAVVVHPVRPAPWGVSIRQQKKVLFDALLFKKHPVLYREKIRRAPRWDYYFTVAALAACLLGFLFASDIVAAGAGSLWLLLTGRFCMRRLRHTSKAVRHVAEMIVTSALIPPLAVFWRLVGACKFRVGFV